MNSLITISGWSGAGKTALTDALAQKLDNPLVVKFDDIDGLMDWIGSYADWYAGGADYEEFKLERMKAHVAELMQASPARWVLFDYPYGRLHSAFREVIDLAVFVDTPLDVAMARRILRDLPSEPVEAHGWIKDQLQDYLTQARAIFLHFEEHVRPRCDLVVDGTKPLPELVATVLHSVHQLQRGEGQS